MAKLKVGVLFGGRSAEHPISVLSARGVGEALRQNYEVVPIGIARDGSVHLGRDVEEVASRLAEGGAGVPVLSPEVVQVLRDVDVVFPVLHGPYGEDGVVQGFLETVGCPYVGSGVLASAIGMDKVAMKLAFGLAGLPQLPWRLVREAEWRRDARGAEEAVGELGYPLFVKPANMGSSIGVSRVLTEEELPRAMAAAFAYDRRVVVEKGLVAPRELECGVLGDEEPEVSVVGEVVVHRPFYDYTAKYEGGAEVVVPAPVPERVAGRVRELAAEAFRAVGAVGFARVDFFLVGEEVYVNEINTIPGFTPYSMFPKVWEASGVSFPELVARLVEMALSRHGRGRLAGEGRERRG